MDRTFAPVALAACASFAMIGCMAPEDEVPGEDHRQVTAALVPGDPPSGDNHFAANPFWAIDTQTAYRALGAGALVQSSGRLPPLEINPAYRIQVLRNAIECGLGQDQTVTDRTGVVYTGHWGLARSWMTEPLTLSQRRYVTACMAQRLNAFELPVTILLNGLDEAINTDANLDPDFPFDESTVWGDLFSSVAPVDDDGSAPFVLYACTDSDLNDLCTTVLSPEEWLDLRICDTSDDRCGLMVLGNCDAVCTTGAPAAYRSSYPVCDSVVETVHVQLAVGSCIPTP